MLVTELLVTETNNIQDIAEAIQPQPTSVIGSGPMRQPMRPMMPNPTNPMTPPTGLEGPPPSGLTQFEDIKKYILFGRLKDINRQLDLADLNKEDPQIIELMEFIDLIVYFYNTFTYEQINHIMDILSEVIATQLKIKLPDRIASPPNREDLPPPPPPEQEDPAQSNIKKETKPQNKSNNTTTDDNGNKHIFIHHLKHNTLPKSLKVPELKNEKQQVSG